MLKIGFISLGCPKNQVDTEVMLHKVMDAGYEITGEDIDADIVIINTCAFIESAKRESIDNILDCAWLKQKKLKAIIVTGCMAERYREQVIEEMPEVDAVIGVGSLDDIVEAVRAVERGEKYASFKDKNECPLGGERVITTPEYMAYLKIAEGCDNRCSYCAIPSIRGRFRSRPMEDIVEEAKTLQIIGVKELVIVAQDTSRYGLDLYGEYKLAELVHKITEATEIPWIRLLYCYPDKITDALIAEFKNNPRLLPYMDMPIQHISDRVLKAMNRHGDSQTIRQTIARLRGEVPNIALRTTAIVGFPGETDEEFAELCEFVREMKFERFGAFAYSQEEDTAAAELDGQIDEQTKQNRLDRLMQIQLDVSEANNRKLLGRTLTVLCEGFDPVAETHFGRSMFDAPEIDGKIYFTTPGDDPKPQSIHNLEGEFVRVKITDTLDYDLTGIQV